MTPTLTPVLGLTLTLSLTPTLPLNLSHPHSKPQPQTCRYWVHMAVTFEVDETNSCLNLEVFFDGTSYGTGTLSFDDEGVAVDTYTFRCACITPAMERCKPRTQLIQTNPIPDITGLFWATAWKVTSMSLSYTKESL